MSNIASTPITSARRRHLARSVIQVCCWLIVVVCVADLLGWILEMPLLTSWVPGWPTMKFMTATGMLVTGVSLLLAAASRWPERRRWRRALGQASTVLACGPLLVGAVVLGLFVVRGMVPSEKEMLATHGWLALPAPATALNLLLYGLALLAWLRPRGLTGFWICVGTASVLSCLALVSVAYRSILNDTTGVFATVSLPSTVSMLVICLGLFCLRPQEEVIRVLAANRRSGGLVRLLLPLAVMLAFAFGLVRMWAQHYLGVPLEIAVALYSTLTMLILVMVIMRNAVTSDRLDRLREASERRTARGLKATQRALTQARAFLEAAPGGMVVVDAAGKVVLVNSEIEQIFGYEHGQLLGTSVERLIPAGVRFDVGLDEQRTRDLEELRGRRADGSMFEVEASFAPLETKDGRMIIGSFRDIAKRRTAEQALMERERRFRGIFENTFQFIGLTTPDGVLLEANLTALRLIGAEASDVVGKHFWDCPWWSHSATEQERLREGIARAAKGEMVRFQTWHPATDGTRRQVDFSLKPVTNELGEVVFLVPEGHDITDMLERQAEQLATAKRYQHEIQLNQKRLEEAQRLAKIGHWEWDLASGLVTWSEELFRFSGLDAAQGAPSFEAQEKLITRDSWKQLVEASQNAVANGTGYELEFEMKHPTGESRWFISRAQPVRDEGGKVVRFFGTTQDITAQKLATLEREHIAQRLQLATQTAKIGIWDWDMVTNQVFWDDLMYQIYHIPRTDSEIVYEVWDQSLHPDDREEALAALQRALANEQEYDKVFRILWPDGTVRHVHAKAIVQRDAGGKAMRMLGTNADITAQVTAEAALLESEERFRQAFEYSAIGFALVETDGTWMAANKAVCEIVGYTEEELRCLRFQDITHADDLDKDLDNMQRLLRGEITHYQMEKRYLHKDGHIVWIVLTGSLVRKADGSPSYFIAQIEDITQRHEAERVLKYQKEQLRMFIEHTPAAVAMFDMDMRYLAASRRWVEDYKLLGRSLEGCSHYEVFPEIGDDWKAIHQRCLAGAVESRDEDMFRRENGQEEWLRWAVRPWMKGDGEIGGIVMFTEVITERKRAAEKLRTSLEEKEVLLREIHHRVKNNMQIISSLLQLQTSALHDPADVAIFQDCQTRIHAMAMVHDRLYRSGNLSTIDFGEHLSEIARLIARGQASSSQIQVETKCDHVDLDLDKAIPLGLIATELITNAFKHGVKQRSEGRINVLLQKMEGTQMRLRVSDDGVGLPPGVDPVSARTLGLRLVRSLSRQLRADTSFPPQETGCCVDVVFDV